MNKEGKESMHDIINEYRVIFRKINPKNLTKVAEH